MVALDAFRGLTVAAMLLVNNPGNGDAVYAPFAHAAWNGWTPTDLIFPFFLFIVGITTELSLATRAERGDAPGDVRRQIVRRAALIVGIGLLLNWFPFYQSGAIDGHAAPGVADRLAARLAVMRIPGVLQRIGVAYAAAALLAWRAPNRRVVATVAALLAGYWALVALVPIPGVGAPHLADPGRTLQAWTDQRAFDLRRWGLGFHLWDPDRPYDPEGLLSTLPAIGTALLGVLAGRWLTSARHLGVRVRGLALAGVAGFAGGLAWDRAFAINKQLWTSSYVLLSAGAACLVLAACLWLIDVRGRARWAHPLVVYGTNPLVAFAGSEMLAHFVHSTFKVRVDGRRLGLEQWTAHQLTAAGLPPAAASLGYAMLFVAAWYFILRALHRRGIVIRA